MGAVHTSCPRVQRLRTFAGAVMGALVAVLLTVAPARADFPGGNGLIAFESTRTDEFDIYTMTPGGGGLKRLTSGIEEDHAPVWSADGKRIAFYRSAFGGPGDIWIMNANGSRKKQLTSGPVDDEDPAWSPNGQKIVFWRGTKKRAPDLYVIRADGTHLRRLTRSPSVDVAPTWSERGRIAFTSYRTGNGDIYLIRPDGSGLRRMTRDPRADLYPDWAPDGRRIVFFERGGAGVEADEIYVLRVRDAKVRRLTRNATSDAYPVWSPDGDQILFHSDRSGTFDIFVMDTHGRGVKPLTHGGFVDGLPDWQSSDPGVQDVIDAAYSVIGVRYRTGGDSPREGFDCSGLTRWAWAHAGVWLPHSAGAQYGAVRHVRRSELRPGDLVFFYSPIRHVGLYVGRGRMIDAPKPGRSVTLRRVFWGYLVAAGRPG